MFVLFFFNDTATTEIYTLSLHDALPIWRRKRWWRPAASRRRATPSSSSTWFPRRAGTGSHSDRKSTRLNSSHSQISYAVFCLKKKTKTETHLSNSHTEITCLLPYQRHHH